MSDKLLEVDETGNEEVGVTSDNDDDDTRARDVGDYDAIESQRSHLLTTSPIKSIIIDEYRPRDVSTVTMTGSC